MLSLFINGARLGSSRLAMLFREDGFKAYNEPFHITKKNKEKIKKRWGGDRRTIVKNSNLTLRDITFDYGANIEKKIYSTILEAYAKSKNFYIIGLQHNSFKRYVSDRTHIKPRELKNYNYFTEFCSIYPCIFIQRKNIDIYISKLKVKLSKIYYGADTTDIKVKANAEEFKIMLETYSNFYNTCYSAVMNSHQNVTIINYEDWANGLDHEQLDKIRFILRSNKTKFFKLPSKEFVDIPTQSKYLKKNLNTKTLKRQDKNLLWEDKISNYSEFIGECKKIGIEESINKRQINF